MRTAFLAPQDLFLLKVRITQKFYDKATSAFQMNGSMGEWFRTTVGVKQGYLLSPILFNSFLERIMYHALEERDEKASIGVRYITTLRFAYDIDAIAEEEQELEALAESLNVNQHKVSDGDKC